MLTSITAASIGSAASSFFAKEKTKKCLVVNTGLVATRATKDFMQARKWPGGSGVVLSGPPLCQAEKRGRRLQEVQGSLFILCNIPTLNQAYKQRFEWKMLPEYSAFSKPNCIVPEPDFFFLYKIELVVKAHLCFIYKTLLICLIARLLDICGTVTAQSKIKPKVFSNC